MAAPKPVWINGMKYPSLFRAAEILSARFGTTIRTGQLKDSLEKHGGRIERKGTPVKLSLSEPAEEEVNTSETIVDTGSAWKETEAPPVEKKRRLLAIPHWDPAYGGIPERWR
jgi:hypothetical protein